MSIPRTYTPEKTSGTDRSAARVEVTERILEVTGEEAERVGPERIRMGEIAARAHVSRASLYRYFASKDDLVRAWTTRELDEIFRRIDIATSGQESFEDRLAESFAVALTELRAHPVFRAVFAINDTQIMRSTLQSSDAIAHARDLATERINAAVQADRVRINQFDAEVTSEILTRLVFSLAQSPESVSRLNSADDARDFARSYLAPMVQALENRAGQSK